ncbi:MAG TPA: prepilin-type N-terminal cleavage/methylation domain-containing protein [Burkholderiaceae bacterium]
MPRSSVFRARGFTLLELLVVVSLIAIATAGVSFAIRDSADALVEREAQRLAALLDTARARSRTLGMPVYWRPVPRGFRFDGLQPGVLPETWLHEETITSAATVLVLGPEPILARQAVVVELQGKALRVVTDGVRPFAVEPVTP